MLKEISAKPFQRLIFAALLTMSCAAFSKTLETSIVPFSNRYAKTLESRTDIEGWVEGNYFLETNQKWTFSFPIGLSFKAPANDTAPIVLLGHGISQSRMGFQDLLNALDVEFSGTAGFLVPDFSGAGETLLNGLPLNYKLPLTADAELMTQLIAQIKKQFPNNPLHIIGVSYGAAVALEALASSEVTAQSVDRLHIWSYTGKDVGLVNEVEMKVLINEALLVLPPEAKDTLEQITMRELIYGRSPILEPIIYEAPYPWTLEAVALKGESNVNFDVTSKVRALEKSVKIETVFASDDAYVDYRTGIDLFFESPNIQTVTILGADEHKIDQGYSATMASLFAQTISMRPKGIFTLDPEIGTVAPIGKSSSSFTVTKSASAKAKDRVWRLNYFRAVESWQNPQALMTLPINATQITQHYMSFFQQLWRESIQDYLNNPMGWYVRAMFAPWNMIQVGQDIGRRLKENQASQLERQLASIRKQLLGLQNAVDKAVDERKGKFPDRPYQTCEAALSE